MTIFIKLDRLSSEVTKTMSEKLRSADAVEMGIDKSYGCHFM